MKVIHIVESLHKGAVENWLIRMYKYGIENGHKLDWTFYCIESFAGRHEEKVLALGAKIIHSEYAWSQPFSLVKALRAELKMGCYDVMHCHHDFMSSLYLMASFNISIKKIVHVHNMDEHLPTGSKLKAAVLRPILRRVCWLMADNIVGISTHTLNRFILNRKRIRKKSVVHYCGVEHISFLESEINKEKFCDKYELPQKAKIILFCARIDPIKNPLFAIDLFGEIAILDESYFMLMVGQGGLSEQVKEKIQKLKLENKVKFIGWSDDIPLILKNSDVLFYPHLEYPMEGLGLIIVESQLSRLPIVSSLGVGEEAFFNKNFAKRLSLNDKVSEWHKFLDHYMQTAKVDKEDMFLKFENSPFYMKTAFKNLMNLHETK